MMIRQLHAVQLNHVGGGIGEDASLGPRQRWARRCLLPSYYNNLLITAIIISAAVSLYDSAHEDCTGGIVTRLADAVCDPDNNTNKGRQVTTETSSIHANALLVEKLSAEQNCVVQEITNTIGANKGNNTFK